MLARFWKRLGPASGRQLKGSARLVLRSSEESTTVNSTVH